MTDRVVPVEALMDAPPGTERRGDEFHDPEHWIICRDCGFDNPNDFETCLRCGADLTA